MVIGGVALCAMVPRAALGYAVNFGVAGTGTLIASLNGAAVTTAALAFLGGGPIYAGGLCAFAAATTAG